MKVVLVYNAGAGGHSSLNDLKKVFDEASVEIIDSIKIGPRFAASLKPHVKKGEVIAVVGGDGTISAVANIIRETSAVLMPLPGGTLNHFTKDLGIPQSLPDALAYFKTAKKVKIDVGQIGDTVFINNSSIGIYSDSLVDRDEHKNKYGKWPAMVTSVFTAFFRYRTYRVKLNGKQYSTPLVFVGNNTYEPKGLAFQRSGFNGGVLSVYMVIGTSRLNLFLATFSLVTGRKNVFKKLKFFTTEDVVIQTKKPMRVSRDGEHEKMAPPLKYSIKKSSLQILRQNKN